MLGYNNVKVLIDSDLNLSFEICLNLFIFNLMWSNFSYLFQQLASSSYNEQFKVLFARFKKKNKVI